MAIATQSAGLVRQKAYNAVYGTGTGTTTNTVSPYHFYAIKALFLHLAMNKGNPDLQFIPYTAEQITTQASFGFNPDVDASTLYCWFGKARRTSGTTDAFETLLDATVGADSDVETTIIAINRIRAVGQQFLEVWPNGYAIATDLTIQSTTSMAGPAAESTAANATDGFLIISA